MRLLLVSLVTFLACLQAANASPVTYTIEIQSSVGSVLTTLGTGQVTYDTSLVQRQGAFTFVAPGGLGLLSLEIDVIGFHLNLANAVNGPNMPTLYLDPGTLAPGSFELWGAWGNTGLTDGPGFQFARGFEYDPSAHSFFAGRSGDGSSTVGARPGPGSTGGYTGTLIYTSTVPEPSTYFLVSAAALPLLLRRRIWRF